VYIVNPSVWLTSSSSGIDPCMDGSRSDRVMLDRDVLDNCPPLSADVASRAVSGVMEKVTIGVLMSDDSATDWE